MDNSTETIKETNSIIARVGTQWLIGGLITLIPLLTVIYFIFVWEPDREDTATGTNEITIADSLEIQPAEPIAPVVPSLPPNLNILEQKSQALARQPATKAEQQKALKSPLPRLDYSDDQVLDGLSSLSPLLEWYIWLYTDEVVRKFVAVIDNIAEGKIVSKYISIPKPDKPFKGISGESDKQFLDPASYERYNVYADIFDSLDNQDLVRIYWRYFPLLEQAYTELGYSEDRKFHGTLLNAIDSLLTAPVIHDEIALEPRTSVIFKFADPALEALPSAHKQLIRMGPRNTMIITRKLEQLKIALSE